MVWGFGGGGGGGLLQGFWAEGALLLMCLCLRACGLQKGYAAGCATECVKPGAQPSWLGTDGAGQQRLYSTDLHVQTRHVGCDCCIVNYVGGGFSSLYHTKVPIPKPYTKNPKP